MLISDNYGARMKHLALITFSIFFFVQAVFAVPVAKLYSKEGSVQGRLASVQVWKNVDRGQKFEVSDAIKTLANSRAGVRFESGFLIRLSEKTELTFTKEMADDERPITQRSGKSYFFSRDSRKFPKVNTPHVSASVRGTEFVIEVKNSETIISVLEGQVEAKNKYGEALVGVGEYALVRSGKAPIVKVMLNPTDAVEWALYYPRGLNPKSAKSKVDLALVELVKNNKKKARELITPELAKGSSDALLVNSYIQQAEFDLEGAKSSLERLLRSDPDNHLARARLAELYLAFGDSESAKKEVSKVLADDASHSYALSVRGFSHLVAGDSNAASSDFKKAIEVDQGFSLPRLGLGLASIKSGDLSLGRSQLEDAVHLEPNVSLYRSYLGKAFFEEESEVLAGREYARAIELDSNDPTPHLYRSFLRLSQHRPIEALKDLRTSIELNNNRSVYRSRFLLDQDLGTRSASLGRVYNRLGFSELARIEAFKSLSKDYANFSAHFLLADLYSETHLTTRSQTAENLIGRLLVPATFNSNERSLDSKAGLNEYTSLFERPQDRVSFGFGADSDLERVTGLADYTYSSNKLGFKFGYAGTDRSGFRENDFRKEHQFFTQGQYQLTANDTLIWDAALNSSEQGDVVINSDPFDEDKDVETELDSGIVRLGVHKEVGINGHLIAQVFYNRGDFERDNLADSSRLGFINVTDGSISLTPTPFPFTGSVDDSVEINQDLYRGDLQYIWDSEEFSFVLGTSLRYEKLDQSETGSIGGIASDSVLSFLSDFPLSSADEVSQNSQRYFLYNTWHANENLDLTAGIVYSEIDLVHNESSAPFVDANFKDDKWSPKLGVMYQLTADTSLRAAYAETLDRTQSGGVGPLEPTFVGGFNQVFDGIRGSEQDFYGIGIDHAHSIDTYFGASFQYREIDLNHKTTSGGLDIVSGSLVTTEAIRESDLSASADEKQISLYLYQLISEQLASNVSYTWEDFSQADLSDFETHKVSWELNYFCPSGIFTFASATWRKQNEESSSLDRDRDFWILNTGVGYEFDKRHGSVRLRLNNLLDKSYHYSHIRDEGTINAGLSAVLDLNYNF